ncbi:MAG TPA: FHA domain-containing protein [Phototrophicaceae bacterium]|nr:FHA domain-containing protein [Phototrophicaceae bacterium]
METTQQVPPNSSWGHETLASDELILFYLMNTTEAVIFPRDKRVVLGRATLDGGINLTPYGAEQDGVSRLHAAVEVQGDLVFLMDLGSTNGTFLNNQRLKPNHSVQVRSGDQVRLGIMTGYVYFSKLEA